MTFSGYDKAYLEEYQRRAGTPLGQLIYEHRWMLVEKYCEPGRLLDYGCADGAFHEMAPSHFDATGVDVNPYSRYCHPPVGQFDILTMWDVIEHLPEPLGPVIGYKPKWVIVSTPNAENTSLKDFTGWMHFKPREHLHYYTPLTLAMSMRSIGYECLMINHDEGCLRNAENPNAIFEAVFKRCTKTQR